LRDEVIYLKVKLRKEGTLQRSEYATVRDRLDDLRSQATNYTTNYTPSTSTNSATASAGTTANRAATTSTAPSGTSSSTSSSTARTTTTTTPAASGSQVEVPSGTELDVRLTNTLNSGTAQVEDRFEGTTLVDLNINGRTA